MPSPFFARDHYPVERADSVQDETPTLLRDHPPKRTVLLELTPLQVLALAGGQLVIYEGERETLLIGIAHAERR